ncbi:hypothetical protein ACFQ14_05805 [Pseudahrensia aquimaris]|uniref:SMI1/KNR4 family protein n=1 Tax=Pseudahrensia aquimaris TaxID=744461 RepID=A0ABW3FF59_9HYPH
MEYADSQSFDEYRLGSMNTDNEPFDIGPVDLGLEIAELEMILSMKHEEGLSFEAALRSALAVSGNEQLFAFPSDRFPLDARAVFAIRVRSGDEHGFCYAYECGVSGAFLIAEQGDIGERYIAFAASYSAIIGALDESWPLH